MKKLLVIGYGNPGRLDDGLGPLFIDALAKELGIGLVSYDSTSHRIDISSQEFELTLDSDYQLNVEDAARIADSDLVVFVDASVSCQEPFYIYPLEPGDSFSFSSHSVTPAALMNLVRGNFQSETEALMLEIRGYEFNEFGEDLSQKASDNLNAAVIAFIKMLNNDPFKKEI